MVAVVVVAIVVPVATRANKPNSKCGPRRRSWRHHGVTRPRDGGKVAVLVVAGAGRNSSCTCSLLVAIMNEW